MTLDMAYPFEIVRQYSLQQVVYLLCLCHRTTMNVESWDVLHQEANSFMLPLATKITLCQPLYFTFNC